MKNSEIGSYEHFQANLPPVLSLDLYLKLEKRRKESREKEALSGTPTPDGQFDFDNVNDEELREDGVDKNFLAECQHIHNKVLFDSSQGSSARLRFERPGSRPSQGHYEPSDGRSKSTSSNLFG